MKDKDGVTRKMKQFENKGERLGRSNETICFQSYSILLFFLFFSNVI